MFNKSLLYPPFALKLGVFEAKLYAAKLPFYGFCGMRSFEEQLKLYEQGRSSPGKIVTKSRPGYSFHNYGVAADYVEDSMPDKPGLQWAWNLKADLNADGRKDWQHMADIAKESGLESGFYWSSFPDPPHIQLRDLPSPVILLNLYEHGGMPFVWAELDKQYKLDV